MGLHSYLIGYLLFWLGYVVVREQPSLSLDLLAGAIFLAQAALWASPVLLWLIRGHSLVIAPKKDKSRQRHLVGSLPLSIVGKIRVNFLALYDSFGHLVYRNTLPVPHVGG